MRFSLLLQRLILIAAAFGLISCGSVPETDQALRVRNTFEAFKSAFFAAHAKEALSYIDRPTLDYLHSCITEPPPANASDLEIRQLIRQTVEKMTPGGIGPNFTLDVPLQRILDEGWMNTHDLDSIDLGPITVKGTQAQGEVLWEGKSSTYQLVFVEEGEDWKVDLAGVLPYAAMALRMDRMMKNETETQQVDRLVKQVPVP